LCVLDVCTPIGILAGRRDQQEDLYHTAGRCVPTAQDLGEVLDAMFRTAELHVRPWHEGAVLVEADDLDVPVPQGIRRHHDLAVIAAVLDRMADRHTRAASAAELLPTSPVQALEVVARPVLGSRPPLVGVQPLGVRDGRLVFFDWTSGPDKRVGDRRTPNVGQQDSEGGEDDCAHGNYLQSGA